MYSAYTSRVACFYAPRVADTGTEIQGDFGDLIGVPIKLMRLGPQEWIIAHPRWLTEALLVHGTYLLRSLRTRIRARLKEMGPQGLCVTGSAVQDARGGKLSVL
ncbi:hypothetical protein NDU88_000342 [Pleurodeles waltl]|uniref:Uncharacterized protein n=1 Tax=Pleurodeles waltl TaxID=8319 RepID=A0AAV7LEF7_PLEWA|nr:hypothetical protein NDU88_000342 [Pleurodeles waltl]